MLPWFAIVMVFSLMRPYEMDYIAICRNPMLKSGDTSRRVERQNATGRAQYSFGVDRKRE